MKFATKIIKKNNLTRDPPIPYTLNLKASRSSFSNLSIGVRQCCILSPPLLFNIFISDLATKFIDLKCGPVIGDNPVNSICNKKPNIQITQLFAQTIKVVFCYWYFPYFGILLQACDWVSSISVKYVHSHRFPDFFAFIGCGMQGQQQNKY